MKMLMILEKILWLSFVSYVIEWGGGAASWADGAWDNSDKWSDGAWDDKGAWKSEPEKQDNPTDKYTRWKISQAKKEAVKSVIDGPNNDILPKGIKAEDLKNDGDFQSLIDEMVKEKLQWYWIDKINKIDEFETKFQKDEFFNQFKEAGKTYAEYWLSIDPSKWGEILADIEQNWFTPAQLILLANADAIIWKLKWIPRSPMSTDDGSRVIVDRSNMTMSQRLAAIKENLLK